MTGQYHELTPDEGAALVEQVLDRVETAAVVDREVLRSIMSAVLAKGHVLLEDVPGTGKTVTARVFAEAMDLEFTRIQFTPDLLPSDVTGSNIYNEHEGSFEFSEGPVFTNVLLADEINRAPPKTQAALLEAMEERQVSVDGHTHDLPEPFVVIATQNPVEQEGTFRLPEAQRDRFSVKTSLGYPDVDGEMGLLDRRANRRSLAPSVDPATEGETILELQELAEDVTVEQRVRRYIIDLARATRRDDRTEIGVSPRGVQRVFEAARSHAVIEGREFVTPDDVKRLAPATMGHRVVLTTEATVEGVESRRIVEGALNAVDVPAVSPEASEPPESEGDDSGAPPGSNPEQPDPSAGTPDGQSSDQAVDQQPSGHQPPGGSPRQQRGGERPADGTADATAPNGGQPNRPDDEDTE